MFPAPKKGRKERRARGGGEREKKFAVIAPGRENCEDGWTGGRTRPVAAKNLQVLSFPREMEESSARRCGGRIYIQEGGHVDQIALDAAATDGNDRNTQIVAHMCIYVIHYT